VYDNAEYSGDVSRSYMNFQETKLSRRSEGSPKVGGELSNDCVSQRGYRITQFQSEISSTERFKMEWNRCKDETKGKRRPTHRTEVGSLGRRAGQCSDHKDWTMHRAALPTFLAFTRSPVIIQQSCTMTGEGQMGVESW
jgi:hypothetical protein